MSRVRLHFKNEFVPIALIGMLFLALVALDGEIESSPLRISRFLLGLFFFLFVPGYALQAALFPYEAEFDNIERIALSLGLSLAIIPPLGFFLDRLPWGLQLWPILITEGILSASFAAVVLHRRKRIPLAERFSPSFEFGAPNAWLREQDRSIKIFSCMLAVTFAIVVLSAVVMLTVRQPGKWFTEFYILGAENLAQDYPREVRVHADVEVTVGISNREGERADYRVRVFSNDALISEGSNISLEDDETIEVVVRFAPVEVGENISIEFRLFEDNHQTPCCTLRLWLDVKPAVELQ